MYTSFLFSLSHILQVINDGIIDKIFV